MFVFSREAAAEVEVGPLEVVEQSLYYCFESIAVDKHSDNMMMNYMISMIGSNSMIVENMKNSNYSCDSYCYPRFQVVLEYAGLDRNRLRCRKSN